MAHDQVAAGHRFHAVNAEDGELGAAMLPVPAHDPRRVRIVGLAATAVALAGGAALASQWAGRGAAAGALGQTLGAWGWNAAAAEPPHGERDVLQRGWSPEAAEQARAGRRGSFIVVGDWGYDQWAHGNAGPKCQEKIGQMMEDKFRELGDVKLIINVGDSFYSEGVASKQDPQWQEKWRNKYAQDLRDVPWYSVYGNHDYHKDPCACDHNTQVCAQVNGNKNDRNYFYMPDVNFWEPVPELGMEIVGMDLNKYMNGWNRSAEMYFSDCQHTPCMEKCKDIMDSRAEQAFDLFNRRHQESMAKNLVVFSHYPTDYFSSEPKFIQALSDNSRHNILYLGGHRHSTDKTTTFSTYPNDNWLVGGGGGWSCDSDTQGFLVVEVGLDYSFNTYPVLITAEQCCPPPPPEPWTPGCGWIPKDNCLDTNEVACKCRELNEGPCTECPDSRMKDDYDLEEAIRKSLERQTKERTAR